MKLLRETFVWLTCILLSLIAISARGQASQNPSPMTDSTRPHLRIEKVEAAGKRVALGSLKGATLFTAAKFKNRAAVPLIIHFHGAPWLIERHIAEEFPNAALITVQLGAGVHRHTEGHFPIPSCFPA